MKDGEHSGLVGDNWNERSQVWYLSQPCSDLKPPLPGYCNGVSALLKVKTLDQWGPNPVLQDSESYTVPLGHHTPNADE